MNWGFCGNPDCGLELNRLMNEKLNRDRNKEFKRETKRRKEALMTVSDWTKKVQKVFNAYIRERDKKLPCISCSRMDCELTGVGNGWDAGHFRSTGAFPELRFEPLNAHRQCRRCNRGGEQWTNGGASVQRQYRKNLAERIGQENLDWLEGHHNPKRYRIEELKELHDHWNDMLKKEKKKQ
jgi:hypothetical protein